MSRLSPKLVKLWWPEVFQAIFTTTIGCQEEESGTGEIEKEPTAQIDSQEEGRCSDEIEIKKKQSSVVMKSNRTFSSLGICFFRYRRYNFVLAVLVGGLLGSRAWAISASTAACRHAPKPRFPTKTSTTAA